MADFTLDARLEADTAPVAELTLSSLRLMKDARYPWAILIPRRAGVREIHGLTQADQRQLLAEITRLSAAMQQAWSADKMNVAALGNMVAQLHVHVIARFAGDAAWPGPVWGVGASEPYAAEALEATVARLSAALRSA
ncbi:MAG: HIT family protein [Alphaproteobacteria bacterium]|nr:HIT family protein [Alphaproteobacteria bacterium]